VRGEQTLACSKEVGELTEQFHEATRLVVDKHLGKQVETVKPTRKAA
jgi:hypothetical protein